MLSFKTSVRVRTVEVSFLRLIIRKMKRRQSQKSSHNEVVAETKLRDVYPP